jgi:hypothetical protein
MNESQIKGGATLWARQTIESEIFYHKPAEWFKIWFYLVNRVNWKTDKKYKRGEVFLKYGYITTATNTTKNQVDSFIRWAKSAEMLSTQKTTRGMIIKIANYSKYQTLDNYYFDIKTDTETETEPKQNRNRTDTILKKEKKEKKENIPFVKNKRAETFKREDYNEIISKYEDLKKVKFAGTEYLPIQQSIKSMFLDGRKKEDIIALMETLNNSLLDHWQSWTIYTVKKQLPLFLSGRLKF